MNITVSVAAGQDVAPDSPTAIDAAHSALAQQATTWTDPVFVGETTTDGVRILSFTADAVPRVPGVTLDSVSSVLRPARVL